MPPRPPETPFYGNTDNATVWRNVMREYDYLYEQDEAKGKERFIAVLEDVLVALRESSER